MSVHRFRRGPVPDPRALEALRGVATSTVSDALGRTGALAGIKAVGDRFVRDPSDTLVGRALTVHTRPGGNLAIHAALEAVEPGDVVVIDGGGDTTRAITGELVVLYAEARGALGVIVDGAIRDAAAIASLGIPVFAKGTTPVGPHRDGPGSLHAPVVCGGVRVRDGDIVVGDADGVVIVPFERLLKVAEDSSALAHREEAARPSVATGSWRRPWLDEILEIVDAPSD